MVVNTPGGTGIVGSKTAMVAKPDGYTMLFGHTGSNTVQQATETIDFDYNKDFLTAGTAIQDNTYTVVVKKSSGWKNLQEFIAYAKANPGKVRYSQVYGTVTHYVGSKMEETMGIQMNMLDVGAGGAERLAAFMGDQVDVLAANYLNVRDYIEKGDFIPLGVCSAKPMPAAPNIPTFKSQGYDIDFPKSYEIKFPKNTDPRIVAKMQSALKEITEDPEFKDALAKYCAIAVYRSGEQSVEEDAKLVEEVKKSLKD